MRQSRNTVLCSPFCVFFLIVLNRGFIYQNNVLFCHKINDAIELRFHRLFPATGQQQQQRTTSSATSPAAKASDLLLLFDDFYMRL